MFEAIPPVGYNAIVPHISAIVEHFPYLGLFGLLIFGGLGLPFPEDTTLILCGFLIFTNVVKPLPALLVVYAGVLLTDLLLYGVGRKYGPIIVTHKRFHKMISMEKLTLLEEKFSRWGILVILFGRHLVGIRAQILLVAGVIRMPFLTFLASDACSASITIAFMVGAGYIGGNSYTIITTDTSRIGHVVVFLIVTCTALYFFLRHIKSARKTSK